MSSRVFPLVALAVGLIAGCLGEPPIEERWTHLEMVSVAVPDTVAVVPGDVITVRLDGRVTFRELMTAHMVGEVRVTTNAVADSLALDDEDALVVSESVDRLIANSFTVSRAVKALAGFPQLRRTVPFEFEVTVPHAAGDTTGTAPVAGVFLVLYLGEGDEIRLEDGRDSLVVTPLTTHEHRVLSSARPIDYAATVVPAP